MRPADQSRVRASLDAAAIRAWCAVGLDALRRHREEIDGLNVYPVPDGDTGTNLVLTFTSAYQALHGSDAGSGAADGTAGPGPALRCLARGALLGARGNSGVILSQLLGGLADALAGGPGPRGREFTVALARAADAAYRAVADPVEGTVLSVARAAADAARDSGSDDLLEVCAAAATAAAVALDHTPQQLPALARAGVVDAGGRGLVVLLDALVAVVGGAAPATAPLARVVRDPAPQVVERESGSPAYGYEVQYLLDAPAVDALRGELAELGDSLVVVGTGDGVWNVHVHVNDVGAAIEAGIRAGRPHRISVTRFADAGVPGTRGGVPGTRGVVVLAEGPGIVALFESEGASVVAGGSPSTREVLAAIRATGAAEVVVLPDDANSHAVCSTAADEARREGIAVAVVPTRCAMQAVAALAVRDPSRRFDDDVIAIAEAAGATRCAEISVASRDALTSAGRCGAGDVLALVEGEVVLVTPGPGPDALTSAAIELLDRMLSSGGELVTLVLGTTAPEGMGEALTRHLRARWPLVEVQSFVGGQPHHPLLVGVE
ncbi:MAG TPA: DAK2 domain-containing protein [Mycobacteriales bacterium]|nr:DAK2 domain-containing protein [Mycobacteriales bacterium]